MTQQEMEIALQLQKLEEELRVAHISKSLSWIAPGVFQVPETIKDSIFQELLDYLDIKYPNLHFTSSANGLVSYTPFKTS